MYRGKRIKKFTHMSKRTALLVLSLVMILSVSVGGTLAYLIAQTGDVTNVFQPGDVTTTTEENFDPKGEKKDVAISTEGSNIDTYIRAQIVVNWIEADDKTVSGQKPVEDVDYTISINDTDWVQGDDGFWYCKEVVKAGEKTPVLINSCVPVPNMGPLGGHLQVTILSQAVQASDKAIEEAWNTLGIAPIAAE